MKLVTLETLLRTEVIGFDRNGTPIKVHPDFRVTVQEVDPDNGVRFIIHADGHDSDTLDYWVKGDRVKPLEEPPQCPHAFPFRYCPSCVAHPCPIGLGPDPR